MPLPALDTLIPKKLTRSTENTAPVIIVDRETIKGMGRPVLVARSDLPDEMTQRPYHGEWVYIVQPRQGATNGATKYEECQLLDLRDPDEDKLSTGKLIRARYWFHLGEYLNPKKASWQEKLDKGLVIGIVVIAFIFIFLLVSSIS